MVPGGGDAVRDRQGDAVKVEGDAVKVTRYAVKVTRYLVEVTRSVTFRATVISSITSIQLFNEEGIIHSL